MLLTKFVQIHPMETICEPATENDEIPDDLLIISCEEDYAACTSFLAKGKPLLFKLQQHLRSNNRLMYMTVHNMQELRFSVLILY